MAKEQTIPRLIDLVEIDANKTLGQLTFKKFEKRLMVFDDKKKESTDEIRGYKFKVESQRLMDIVEITIEGNINVQEFEENPGKFYNQPVAFTGLTIKPYVNTNGNFPQLAWSIKADGIKFGG